MFERLAHRRRVRKRINELDVLIARSRQVRVAWFQERKHIQRTGQLDWVDPNPMRVTRVRQGAIPPPPAPRPSTWRTR